MATFETRVDDHLPDLHDPAGPDVQVHEVGDEVVLTLGVDFLEESGWQAGDVIIWDLQGDDITLSNPKAEARRAFRETVKKVLDGGQL